ncbi:MAG: hypothetical protein KC766_16950, partial [Myxococcales bacterium]|nr:hypothetical protein [Myxococcales bacterium]
LEVSPKNRGDQHRMPTRYAIGPLARTAAAMCAGLLMLVATGALHSTCSEHPEDSGETEHELVLVCPCACRHQHVVADAPMFRIQPDEARDESLLEYENPISSAASLGIFRPPRFLA